MVDEHYNHLQGPSLPSSLQYPTSSNGRIPVAAPRPPVHPPPQHQTPNGRPRSTPPRTAVVTIQTTETDATGEVLASETIETIYEYDNNGQIKKQKQTVTRLVTPEVPSTPAPSPSSTETPPDTRAAAAMYDEEYEVDELYLATEQPRTREPSTLPPTSRPNHQSPPTTRLPSHVHPGVPGSYASSSGSVSVSLVDGETSYSANMENSVHEVGPDGVIVGATVAREHSGAAPEGGISLGQSASLGGASSGTNVLLNSRP